MFFLSLFSFAFLYKEGLLDLVKIYNDNFNCYSKSKKAKQQISINEKNTFNVVSGIVIPVSRQFTY